MTKIADLPLCSCGCGQPVKSVERRWLKGHYFRGVKRPLWTEERKAQRAQLTREQVRKFHPLRGRTKDDHAGVKRVSESKMGDKNPQYGVRAEHSSNWKGGKFTDRRGYVFARVSDHPHAQNGYVAEHILVVEADLGCYLEKGQVVHHVNGKRADNRLTNLWLCSPSQHSRAHGSLITIAARMVKAGALPPGDPKILRVGLIGLVDSGEIRFDRERGVYTCA